ncbi:LuxR C-terminal-related transcriptional regulator [Microbacterium sp.]|uniref:helix-turn-helix transcriptional regulator n=1 Tax=Microbacterium sp. TaxID=51671 RepID=UPI00281256C0|nr:LuxR C-terminal-related transcriptional regulator [Microbacterium sp.]
MAEVLIPLLFVLAGVLGPLWQAARFTTLLLAAVGLLHLSGLAMSLAALEGENAVLHTGSQVLFVAGFAALLPLACGYPSGPAPRWSWLAGSAAVLVPVASGFSDATPTVLSRADAAGRPSTLGPIVAALPPEVAASSGVVFSLPVLAAAILMIRLLRGDRELRGRLTLPLAALAAFAVIIAVAALLRPQAEPLTTTLFLVASPLVPVALVAGSRPLARPLDDRSTLSAPSVDATPADPRVQALSPREREVLALMAAGASNAAIARELFISLSAVEKHTTAIFAKLGLASEPQTHRRVSAVVAYLRATN